MWLFIHILVIRLFNHICLPSFIQSFIYQFIFLVYYFSHFCCSRWPGMISSRRPTRGSQGSPRANGGGDTYNLVIWYLPFFIPLFLLCFIVLYHVPFLPLFSVFSVPFLLWFSFALLFILVLESLKENDEDRVKSPIFISSYLFHLPFISSTSLFIPVSILSTYHSSPHSPSLYLLFPHVLSILPRLSFLH